jgi:uncharacterized membrane protein YeaQ/YmgE (transglycosylase-associated protein family)
MRDFFLQFGLDMKLLFAGFAGALASITKEKELSWFQRFITMMVGGFVSAYMTPIITSAINMDEEMKYGIGFIIGYTGLRTVEWVIEKYFKKKPEDKEE